MSRTTAFVLAASVWMLSTGTAPAQDLDEPEFEAPAADAADKAEPPPFPVDQWIFNGSASAARRKLEIALDQDIRRFDQRYGLTPAQKKKLDLAGARDLKRFYDRIDEVKADYEQSKGDWQKIGERVMQLQGINKNPHTELFGDESMLSKTLKKNLTAGQVARYEKSIYRVRVEWMASLLRNRLKLSAGQQQKLVALVVEETPPLGRYGSFDYDAIMFQMARLPKARIESTLDESQCRELNLRFDQARRMESLLVSEGYVSTTKRAGGGRADAAASLSDSTAAKTVLTRKVAEGRE